MTDMEQIYRDLDQWSIDYISAYPSVPIAETNCRRCGALIHVFSFKDGLCIKCYKKELRK